MMSNIDNITLIKYYIGAFTCFFGMFWTGSIILYQNIKHLKWYHYIIIIFSSICIMHNSLIFDNFFKVFGTILILFLIFKIIYKMDMSISLIITIITYIIFALSEAILILVLAILGLIFDSNLIINTIKTFLGNIIIVAISIGVSFCIRKNINNYLKKINKSNIIYSIMIGIVTVFTVLSSIFKVYTNGWKIDYIFFLNIFIVIGCVTLIMVLIKQYLKNKEIVEKYRIHEEYLKTSAELIEKYSSTIHKYKNNLIALKGYINHDITQANEYINTLLEGYKDKRYSWFSKINNIPIDAIKHMLYYKLLKAEEINLKLSITISEEIKKQNYNELSIQEIVILSDMIGEYLDNAIYAANESLERELILDSYIENNILYFVLSNTFKEKFEIKLITKYGYTTKGKGHGLGLYEIDKIIKKNEFINSSYEILENYFIVKLALNIINFDNKNKE